jgi:hypothetical protein
VNLSDLPPKLRARAVAALARDLARSIHPAGSVSPDAGADSTEGPPPASARPARCRYRCARCGAEFAAWAPAQRHAGTEGHPRIGIVL